MCSAVVQSCAVVHLCAVQSCAVMCSAVVRSVQVEENMMSVCVCAGELAETFALNFLLRSRGSSSGGVVLIRMQCCIELRHCLELSD